MREENVWNLKEVIDGLSQHDELKILAGSSQQLSAIPKSVYEKFRKPHKGVHYFFLFNEQNPAIHQLDLQEIHLSRGELLFVVPHQIHTAPPLKKGLKFSTLSFEPRCLALLPRSYSFLINPLHRQIISFDNESRQRVKILFETLGQLLHSDKTRNNTDTLLVYINALLTELNTAYFKSISVENSTGSKLSKYTQFKVLIEDEFKKQPSINFIAETLFLSQNQLYTIVKEFSGFSPKEYLIQRSMLEAQRILFYEKPSAKELAYELGFADPDYFSRLFKKYTGKNISTFLLHSQDLSRQK
ncbi:MAG TPA: AraC family transcriptional regulator [Cyclobacteriaceae bacterium]